MDFEATSVAAGLRTASPFPSPAETDLETASGYLSDLRSGEILPEKIVSDALQMNRERRREYAVVVQASRNAATLIGIESQQFLPFDKMFSPKEGWRNYLLNFRSPLSATPNQTATKQIKDAGQSPESEQYLSDLVEQGEMAGMATIAKVQAASGDVAGAKATISSALTIARGIDDANDRASTLYNIAQAQAATEDFTGANASFSSALKAARDIDDASLRAEALADITLALADTMATIAKVQAASGDVAGAKATISSALTIAHGIDDASLRAEALDAISLAMSK